MVANRVTPIESRAKVSVDLVTQVWDSLPSIPILKVICNAAHRVDVDALRAIQILITDLLLEINTD